jgi:carboxyl-terminal processing protease
MSYRGKFILALVSAAIAMYAIVGGLMATQAQQPINDAGTQIRIFESVLLHIQNDYVDEPNLDKVRAGALRGLASGLDPYSSYLTAEQVKDYQAKKQNSLAGIGVGTSQISGYLLISVLKDSPAEKAGLKTSDVIEYIENKATHDISLYEARRLLLGEPGSKVNLRVLRAGAKPQIITVTRGAYKIPESEVRLEEGKIGVVKIYSLENGEANDIRNRVSELQKQGVSKIILDLRGVTLGAISEGADVASIFIKDGNLAEIIGRDNKVAQTFAADPKNFLFGGQVITLIDSTTAGAGEVVASAMLERKRGEVVGERSFGSGIEQQLFLLRGGDGLLLTTAKWASASGKTFLDDDRASSGIMPSIEVKRPDTPEPLDVQDLVDQQEQQNQNPQPQASPTATPQTKATPAPPKPMPEDLQLKKALELLRGNPQTVRAAGGE